MPGILVRFTLLVLILILCFTPVMGEPVYAYDNDLKIDHFLANPDYDLTYRYEDSSGESIRFIVKWQKLGENSYKKSCLYPDGMEDFFYYVNKYGQIYETKTGWSIPNSEWTEYEIIKGSNVVFKPVPVYGHWQNQYVTKDAWGNTSREYNYFMLQGMEQVDIMGKSIPAAKLSWEAKSIPQYTSPDAEWQNLPGHSKGEDWFVKGLGLVKRNFVNDNGFVTSSFYLTRIWDNKKNAEVSINQWVPVSIAINGTILQNVNGIPRGGDLLVPVRNILQYFGRPFSWDNTYRTLTVQTEKYGVMHMLLGTDYLKNDIKKIPLSSGSAVSQIVDGNLMVPCSFVEAIMGDQVDYRWDKENNIFEIFPAGTEPVFAE